MQNVLGIGIQLLSLAFDRLRLSLKFTSLIVEVQDSKTFRDFAQPINRGLALMAPLPSWKRRCSG